MNILYVAFPCNPYVGSESKIGWNIPLESAKSGNKVTVITIKDMQKDIEDYISKNGSLNIDFYYVDIPKNIKKIIKKISTIKLNMYHKKIYNLIKKLLKEGKQIDIIHQITPVEFRAVGNYGKFKNIKFVVGPVGGAEEIPKQLQEYAKDHLMVENLRKLTNKLYKILYKITRKYNNIDYIMFANEETKSFLFKNTYKKRSYEVYVETGITQDEINKTNFKRENKICKILIAGRMYYRKGHKLLIDALKLLPKNLEYEVLIVGDGPERKKIENMVEEDNNLKNKVIFLGMVNYEKMKEIYNNVNVLIMPSIRETTGSVILEAMGQNVPVIAMKKYGASLLLDEEYSWLYYGETKEKIILNIANILKEIITNSELIEKKAKIMSRSLDKFLFKNKVKHYNEIYKKILSKK